MPRTHNLGEFEQVVLLSVLRLGDTACGVPIRAEIAKHTGRTTTPGSLDTALERMDTESSRRSKMSLFVIATRLHQYRPLR
jgi:hypothetical protein